MVYKSFYKKLSAARLETLAMWNKFAGGAVKSEIISNQELAEELNKPIIRNIIYRLLIIWSADLADMQIISAFNKGICLLLCVINIFSK